MSSRVASEIQPGRELEEAFYGQGHRWVAGLDEVGRGAWAGPVVAAAVILPQRFPTDCGIRDSKVLRPQQREALDVLIRSRALAVGVGMASQRVIDRVGIVSATRRAMLQAIRNLALRPQALLIDALALGKLSLPQRAIVHGDALCLSIAAASIVAKVARDALMRKVDAKFSVYGFARNKGYGTPEHEAALFELGPCPLHRLSFAPMKYLSPGVSASTWQHSPSSSPDATDANVAS